MDAAADISDPERDLARQRHWYGERASRFMARSQAPGIVVVAAGAAISYLQVGVPRRALSSTLAIQAAWQSA